MAGKRTSKGTGKGTDLELRALMKQPGRYNDGGSLYFMVTTTLSASWEFQYWLRGRKRYMGLGAFPGIGGKKARALRDDARKLIRDGIDPIEARNEKRLAVAPSMTMTQAFEGWIALAKSTWVCVRYEPDIRSRYMRHAAPSIGHLAVSDIKATDIAEMLEPLWNVLASAEELRQNLEATIRWATNKGYRSHEKANCASWERLRDLLPAPKRSKYKMQRKVKHRPSLPYTEVPKFMMELRHREGVRPRALEFIILTTVREGDVCGGSKIDSVPMKWEQVDLDAALWTIPDTKMGKPHTVPLSTQAVALLKGLSSRTYSEYVFPSNFGSRSGTIVARSLNEIVSIMGYAGRACPHGFRASFKTFCEEELTVEKGIIETALAHSQGALDAAYHRGEYLRKRRILMQQWADFLDGHQAKVVQLPKKRA